ncbi:putative glycoside hydrolase [Duganella vulcania]|uniref:GTP-binding protein n=1 Tax=Duganella vulcania TaxID=2692166 RepID=A0A845GWD1_9BURK|nr:putative glycoside hydrolase [Duganella vulcania]MYM97568.1 GTP-binding protein [Duganella vulcania]
MRQLVLAAALTLALPAAHAVDGFVYSQADQSAIAGAIVTSGGASTLTDAAGKFHLPGPGPEVAVRAPGYTRRQGVHADGDAPLRLALTPFQPKAVYLSAYGIGSDALREAALRLVDQTELNALVIDVKSDRGMIPYASTIALAERVGAQKVRTVRDMPALVAQLHQKNIYLIARIVVFKDEPLATAQPDLALKNSQGQIWRDGENLPWVDPMRHEVWQYNLDIAEEAARQGFDEIQFDYVRFPDAPGAQYAQPSTQASRVDAISGFLGAARQRLAPYNVFVAADIFGYVLWNTDDTAIGQQLERLVQPLDYICPMLYPSGFKWGIPNYRNAVAHPYEIVYQSLQRAKQRTGLGGARFRPWLQDFTDYAFDHRPFGAAEVQAQIDAAEAAQSNGWMLWNPRNRYSDGGLHE